MDPALLVIFNLLEILQHLLIFAWTSLQTPWSQDFHLRTNHTFWRLVQAPKLSIQKIRKAKLMPTYEFGHDNTDLLNCSQELIKINASFIWNIEILELLVQEGSFVDVLRVLLLNFLFKLLVKSIARKWMLASGQLKTKSIIDVRTT